MTDYTVTDDPLTGSRGVSSVIRNEFSLISAAIASKQNINALTTASITPTAIPGSVPNTVVMVWETDKSFLPGYFVAIVDRANPAVNNMTGMILDYNVVSGLTSINIISKNGSGTISDWIIVTTSQSGVTLGSNTFTGFQNYSRATVASAATTADIWSALGNQINFTGTATVTGFPAALQAGASRELICAGACVFTAGANMLIDGIGSGSSVTCAANDKMIVRAITTTQFNLTRIRYDGLAQKLVGRNEVLLHSPNGYGSTNTYIRRFTIALVNTGIALTYADSATLGASVTVNEAGIYRVTCSDNIGAGTLIGYGVSKNSTQLTTGIASINAADRMSYGTVNAANLVNQVTTDIYCAIGDVLRHHGNQTTANDTSALSIFGVLKVANA